MKKLFKLVSLLLMLGLLASCSTKEATQNENKNDKDAIKIGFVGPLEGELSVYGNAVFNGGSLYLEEYNAKHGTNYVLVAYDSKGNNTEAVNAYNKLVDEDKVVALFGGVVSGESIAIGSASQSFKTPIISPSATALDFTLTGDNVFRGCFTDPFQAKVLGKFAYNDLQAKNLAIIYDTGSDYSKGLTENFIKEYTALGGNVVANEGYNSGDVDFSAQLTKIAATNPDVLFVPNYYKDVALIVSQARSLGMNAQILGGDGWDGVLAVVEDAKILDGSIFVNHYAPDDADVIAWFEGYKAKYGVDANSFAILAYDTMGVLLSSIENSDLSSESIISSLKTISYDGILGNLKFDENGDPIKDLGYIVIKDGKYQTYSK
ncbi:ABC transporter substrate-binding protein [Erysipelotrichaceae bacterium OH741_COT-311]|nr:ABC transporter substrate-binding protein [Erysipelotrichaceae bacterium OH741_COT-311]